MDKSRVNVRSLRLAINVLRRAQEDYLGSDKTRGVQEWAKESLFGLNSSSLPDACRALDINPHAAKLKLLLWKLLGLKGDPIFDYLEDPQSYFRFNLGLPLEYPTFKELRKEMEIQNIDEVKANKVLEEIDNLLSDQKRTVKKLESDFVKLAALLREAKYGAYWTLRGYKGEEEYIRATFPQSRSQYYTLIGIAEHLKGYPPKLLEEIGRSKCEGLVRIQRTLGKIPQEWFDTAVKVNKDVFRRQVREFMEEKTGSIEKPRDPQEEDHLMTFRLFGDSITVVKKAMDIIARMTGSEKNMGDRLTLLCANFLSQFNEDGSGNVVGQNSFLFETIKGLVKQINFLEDKAADRLIAIIASAVEENTATDDKS